jgi:cyanophycinase
MNKRLALIGGEEFSDDSEIIHRNLLMSLGGKTKVAFLPTAAANDGAETVEYWCTQAREKLSALGAQVETPRVVDSMSANEMIFANQVADADWVYLGGGYAHVALPILQGTRVMESLLAGFERGTLISGSSAGAMMMGEQAIVITPELLEDVGKYWESGAPPEWDPPTPPLIPALNWLHQTIVAPHFDRPWFSRKWLERDFLPAGFTLIGIDERTTLAENANGSWEVFGRGAVTLYKQAHEIARYVVGDTFKF